MTELGELLWPRQGIAKGRPASYEHPGALVWVFKTRVPSGQAAIPLKSVLYGRLGPVGKASSASTAPVVPFSLYKLLPATTARLPSASTLRPPI
ncbi:MAG: hypothetical protein WA631_11665 [Nitrososphaeraceae archaeon]